MFREALAGACLALFLAAPAAAQEGPPPAAKTPLAQRFEKGASWTYRLERSFRQATKAAGQERSMGSRGEYVVDVRVLDRGADGGATLEVGFASFRGTVTQPGLGDTTLDSGRKEDADRLRSPVLLPLLGSAASFLGRKVRLKVGKDGEIGELAGVKEPLEAVRKDLEKDPALAAPATRASLEPLLGEEPLRHELEALFARLPDREVGPGDSWRVPPCARCSAPAQRLDATWSLERVEGGEAVIAVTAVSGGKPTPAEPPGGNAPAPGKGTLRGTAAVEAATGALIRLALESRTETVSTLYVAGQKVDLSLTSELTIKVERRPPGR